MMEKDEITDLVMLAAGNDGREISQVNVEAWHKQFGREKWLTYLLAEAAMVEFYNTETRRIMAADILRLAREIRHGLLLENPLPDTVVVLMADVADIPWASDEVKRAAEDAIIAGRDPVPAAELAAKHRRELEAEPT